MNIDEIHTICKKYDIRNYSINDDLSIDVRGSVYLYNKDLYYLPLNFNIITVDFHCGSNYLTSLEGAPKYVGRNFQCYDNKLKSLEYAPKEVQVYFNCCYNPLESFKGLPLYIDENYLKLPEEYTYNDYLEYCKVVERDLKFKKFLSK